jgi:hypothetical protein
MLGGAGAAAGGAGAGRYWAEVHAVGMGPMGAFVVVDHYPKRRQS